LFCLKTFLSPAKQPRFYIHIYKKFLLIYIVKEGGLLRWGEKKTIFFAWTIPAKLAELFYIYIYIKSKK